MGARRKAAAVGQADLWGTGAAGRPEPPRPQKPAPEPPPVVRVNVPDGTELWRRWAPKATQLVYVPVQPCAGNCTLHEAVGMGCTHCGRGYWLNLTCVRRKEDAARAHAHVAAKPWASKIVLDALWAVLQDVTKTPARRE